MMDRIIISSPLVTANVKKKDVQIRADAAGPTDAPSSLNTVNSRVVLIALAEKCCQKAEMIMKIAATKLKEKAANEIRMFGKGFTSTSEPVVLLTSLCQPGNVARRKSVITSKMIATMLLIGVSCVLLFKKASYIRYGNMISSLK